MGVSTDMNVGEFPETSVSLLKSVLLQLFAKYSQSYANLNVKTRPKIQQPLKINRLFWCFPFTCNLQNSIGAL